MTGVGARAGVKREEFHAATLFIAPCASEDVAPYFSSQNPLCPIQKKARPSGFVDVIEKSTQ